MWHAERLCLWMEDHHGEERLEVLLPWHAAIIEDMRWIGPRRVMIQGMWANGPVQVEGAASQYGIELQARMR